jgi:hypothetical protein
LNVTTLATLPGLSWSWIQFPSTAAGGWEFASVRFLLFGVRQEIPDERPDDGEAHDEDESLPTETPELKIEGEQLEMHGVPPG